MNENPNELKNQDNNPSGPESPSTKYKPLRTWPAFVLLIGMVAFVAARFVQPLTTSESVMLVMSVMMGPTLLGLLVLIWWLAFSRATAIERIVGFVGTIVVAVAVLTVSDSSMMGPATIMLTIPMGTAAFAVGAILFGKQLSMKRTLIAILLSALGFGFTALQRSDGMYANGEMDLHWRWTPSNEDNMLAARDSIPKMSTSEIAESEWDTWLQAPEWPRFRGPGGQSQYVGNKFATDWTDNPPEEIWRIDVGPGWSSFAIAGNLLFTQEQHGDREAVVCYTADSGKEVWNQSIEARFNEAIGGPGPRATPTLADGALYVQGANGQLQRLDPKTGTVIWSQDLRKIADRDPPTWGFSSSPLVVGSVVIVHAGGKDDKGTLAFDKETGDLRWSVEAGDHSYSSPELASIGGNQYVLMLTNAGLDVLDPESGNSLLEYKWEMTGYRALQPRVFNGDSIIVPTGPGSGTRRVRVTKTDSGLTSQDLWTSLQLRPDFNDFVIYENHLYGFDMTVFTCVDLETGERCWKRGRYGNGQVLLLADSGHLLVASEKGDVVLIDADPDEHREIARFKAIEGKTWNHHVVVGDRLYIRNGQEAACFRLPLASE